MCVFISLPPPPHQLKLKKNLFFFLFHSAHFNAHTHKIKSDANGALLVYSITDRTSFTKVKRMKQYTHTHCKKIMFGGGMYVWRRVFLNRKKSKEWKKIKNKKKVRAWVKELQKIVGKNIVIAIAANKCDLEKKRQVSWEDAQEYADSIGASFFRTSAKSGKGVDQLFMEITKRLLEKPPLRRKRKNKKKMALCFTEEGSTDGFFYFFLFYFFFVLF